MSDKRIYPRIRSLLTGRIEFNNRRSTIDCVVREMSSGGAKLELPHAATIPDEFDLRIPHKDQVFASIVRWRAGNFIGVEFERAQPVTTTADPGEALRRLESENALLRQQVEDLRSLVKAAGLGMNVAESGAAKKTNVA